MTSVTVTNLTGGKMKIKKISRLIEIFIINKDYKIRDIGTTGKEDSTRPSKTSIIKQERFILERRMN